MWRWHFSYYMDISRLDGQSLDPQAPVLARLMADMPELFSEGKLDPQKLKAALGEDAFAGQERYGLTWNGKSECFKKIQETTTKTLRPCREESADFDTTGNLFIEGDNLQVLKVLQRSYYGKVKMIYIDPPYNTGNDFIYSDRFTRTRKEELIANGSMDAQGNIINHDLYRQNTRDSGHFHSNWLNMMYPRLFVAKSLLRPDGVIFVSIDDNEVKNLRAMMDEIFGEENFIGDIVWHSTKSVTNTALISVSHTYNLIYAREVAYQKQNRTEFRLPEDGDGFSNPDNDPRGPWKADPFQVGGWRPNQQYEIKNPKTGEIYRPNPGCSWKNELSKFNELLKDDRIVFGATGEAGPQRKRFLSEAEERGRVTTTFWDDVGTTTNGTQLLKRILGGNYFDNPKPVDLIKRFCQLSTKRTDVVLDFFTGSGTTAHAVMQLNAEDGGSRKWICVQSLSHNHRSRGGLSICWAKKPQHAQHTDIVLDFFAVPARPPMPSRSSTPRTAATASGSACSSRKSASRTRRQPRPDS